MWGMAMAGADICGFADMTQVRQHAGTVETICVTGVLSLRMSLGAAAVRRSGWDHKRFRWIL
jgi:hypothetical protein